MIIKKLNSMFHKHGRVLFTVFTFVIIITFLDFLTPGSGGCSDGIWGTPGVGTAFGRKVTIDDLQDLSQQQQVVNMLFYGGNARDVKVEELFQQYCLLEKAAALGISASDREVAQWLAALPVFQRDGKFSEERYREAMEAFRRQGIGETLLNQAVRNIVVLSKLQNEITDGVIVTENEIAEAFRQAGTKYLVGVLRYPVKNYLDKVPAPTAEELRAFFDAERANYNIEGSFSALAAEVPASAFVGAAEKEATNEQLEAFFRANSARFADKDGKTPEFATVMPKVREAFIAERSMALALNRAYEFATHVYDEIDRNRDAVGQAEAFRNFAEKEHITVVEALKLPLSAREIPGVDAPAMAAQLMAVTSANPLTNAVRGSKAAYVGILIERIESRPAEYDEVASQVAVDYRNRAASRLALEAAEKEFAALNSITELPRRSSAFAALKPTTFAFSQREFNIPEGMEMAVFTALQLRAGQISQPLPEPDGSAILVSLLKTVAPDMSRLEAERENIRVRLLYNKRSLRWTGFIEDISGECMLTLPEEGR